MLPLNIECENYVPPTKGVGGRHIVFGAVLFSVGVRIASFPCVIFWTSENSCDLDPVKMCYFYVKTKQLVFVIFFCPDLTHI